MAFYITGIIKMMHSALSCKNDIISKQLIPEVYCKILVVIYNQLIQA